MIEFGQVTESHLDTEEENRLHRIPVDDRGEIANDLTEPPDIAVEIVSPDQNVTSLVRKCLWYVAHGVQVAHLVDSDDRSVVSYGLDRSPRILREDDPIDVGDALPGFTLSVRQLFDSREWPG
jgi:Uma2 family endonuclease